MINKPKTKYVGSPHYAAVHHWIRSNFKKPKRCESCQKVRPLFWALIGKRYVRKRSAFRPLCAHCHLRHDLGSSIKYCKRGHLRSKKNLYVRKEGLYGHFDCRKCKLITLRAWIEKNRGRHRCVFWKWVNGVRIKAMSCKCGKSRRINNSRKDIA